MSEQVLPIAATAGADRRPIWLHLGVLVLLFALQFILPAYDHTNMTRIMILASYAMGYNLLLGYTGLMSLGHAMFFAAGLYGAGLTAYYFGFDPLSAFIAGVVAGLGLSIAVGLIALRTSGVSFMIVTLMFAQACFLLTLYFNEITQGDQGIVIDLSAWSWDFGSEEGPLSLISAPIRYNLALLLFTTCLLVSLFLMRTRIGRVLIAIRENEARAVMLGYHSFRYKLGSLALSGTMSAAAGATYALLFSYVGSTFAGIQYSIFPLLWVLLGGQGTILGPLLGTALMFYLVDISSEYTSSYMLIVGVALVLLVLWFPKGILGTIRQKWLPWLP
jgi:branched-chain amino acid transport system permease protein